MSDKFLDRIYEEATPQDARALYDAWAATYDAEIAENGYATPGRVSAALAQHVPDLSAPVLDFGCGTGLSGLALRGAGFSVIDGLDPSPDMLGQARAKAAGAYRSLDLLSLDDPRPLTDGAYPTIAAIGVIGTGAAPAATVSLLMNALPKGGIFGVSLNDHAIAEGIYEAALSEWLDPGAAHLLFKDYGDHLPGQNMKSYVYIIEKA